MNGWQQVELSLAAGFGAAVATLALGALGRRLYDGPRRATGAGDRQSTGNAAGPIHAGSPAPKLTPAPVALKRCNCLSCSTVGPVGQDGYHAGARPAAELRNPPRSVWHQTVPVEGSPLYDYARAQAKLNRYPSVEMLGASPIPMRPATHELLPDDDTDGAA